MNKYRVEYADDEEDDDGLLIREEEAAPYPDIPAEMPGMITEYNKMIDGDVVVIEDDLVPDEMERAALAAENSGLEFGPAPEHVHREVIDLSDIDDDYEGTDDGIHHDNSKAQVKMEPTDKIENPSTDIVGDITGDTSNQRRSG